MITEHQKTRIIFKRNLTKKIVGKALQYIKRLSLPLNPPLIVTPEDLEKTLIESGWDSFGDFIKRRHTNPLFFQKMDKEFIRNEFEKTFPVEFDTIREKSQKCHQREFNELGSGYMKLGSSEEGICWREDFKSGVVWPLKNYRSVPIIIEDDISDIKTIWELSRFQFGMGLAQMEMVTGESGHRQKFVALVDDWMTGNPYPLGPNWTCPMELAIRAINLICAAELFQSSAELPDDFMRRLCASLFQHGRHIKENIEFVGRGANTNHYLADLIGLLTLGLFFDGVSEAKEWREFAISELEQEIISQTTEDGYCYESSMNYHLMVCEFYLHAFTLCRVNALDFSVPFMRRLAKMIEFTQNSIGPDGKLPNIGDNDSGRLLKLSERADRDPHWILLWARMEGIGPLDFVPIETITAESVWLYGRRELTVGGQIEGNPQTKRRSERSRSFKDSGIYCLAHDDLRMTVNTAAIGVNGLGGHKHNDELALTLCWGADEFIIDPGTFCYTTDKQERNRLRSAMSHSTITINDQETNRFISRYLFALRSDGKPHVSVWFSTRELDILRAEHSCYHRLPNSPTVIRTVFFDKLARFWLIRDQVDLKNTRSSSHKKFKASSSLILKSSRLIREGNSVSMRGESNSDRQLVVRMLSGSVSMNVEPFDFAPQYGDMRTGSRVTFTRESDKSVDLIWGAFPNHEGQNKHLDESLIAEKLALLEWPLENIEFSNSLIEINSRNNSSRSGILIK